jgi:hypothetical protein
VNQPRFKGRTVLAALLVMTASGLSGCGEEKPVPPDDVAYSAPGDSFAALATGTLERRDGCVYLMSVESPDPIVMVFPNLGIRWDGDTLRVGDRKYPMGEEMDFAGGAMAEVPYDATIPDACDADVYWLMSSYE